MSDFKIGDLVYDGDTTPPYGVIQDIDIDETDGSISIYCCWKDTIEQAQENKTNSSTSRTYSKYLTILKKGVITNWREELQ